jgi:hypothetical protein
MYAEGLTWNLIVSGLLVGLFCYWIASRHLRHATAIAVTVVRVGVPVAYFAWYYDGTWQFIDDLFYLSNGLAIHDLGYNVFTLFTDPDGLALLQSMHGGSHLLYTVWNVFAVSLFGEHYWSPVMLNVAATFVTAHVFGRTLASLRFDRTYRSVMETVLLLHWDIFAWSSLINGKDALVQLLTVTLLHAILQLVARRKVIHLLTCIVVSTMFLWLRYYIPFLVACATGLWLLTQWKHVAKYPVLACLVGILIYALPSDSRTYELFHPDGLALGISHYVLQPAPWRLNESTSFLLVPSVLHWTFFVPAVLGGFLVWKNSPQSRLFLLYAIVLIGFYSMVTELQTARHRLQISFVFAWVQAHFLWSMLNRAPASSRAGIVPEFRRMPRATSAGARAGGSV